MEDLGGVPVQGYRAPTFSIGPRNPWAFEVLAEEGYRYSSSIYPVKHDLYGVPDAPRFPYRPGPAGFWEIPMTTVPLGGRNVHTHPTMSEALQETFHGAIGHMINL